jgi:hypothetical protein
MTEPDEPVSDHRPAHDAVLFESSRRFQLWRTIVGHSQMLLRSTKDDANPQRIDVLFKPVEAVKLRTLLHGLRVIELAGAQADAIRAEAAATASAAHNRVYRIESSGFQGWVISGAFFTHTDDLDYHEPSYFLL